VVARKKFGYTPTEKQIAARKRRIAEVRAYKKAMGKTKEALPTIDDMPPVLTIANLVDMGLYNSYFTARRCIKMGISPKYFKIGRSYGFRKEDVLSYFKILKTERKHEPTDADSTAP
jgi:hypothetical protein